MEVCDGGGDLNGAQDSLVDARVQTDIIVHPHFVPFINQKASIKPINIIFSKSNRMNGKNQMDLIRLVCAPWKDISEEDNEQWKHMGDDFHMGRVGGGNAGP